ncbi:olfactory receptor 2AJ1-like [Trichosurus vulpecula]|uniref:olfactory receptor 2AJ1-like n=1 Tax=Trichosurus vulpecula TaxID=9337 RepID=UPI00186AC2BD|nr:olfactory receptor 2AJ1-like [Trichosurus vulpecula]
MWEEENQTFARDFILLGLLHPNQYGLLLLTLILIIFMVAIVGNTVLILLIHLDSRLHTPMYFLLSHLSFMDILHISNTVPKMVSNFISGQHSITFVGCGFQIFLSLVFLGAECLLFAAMSYDRYVAVCHPLHYPILMNHRISVLMAAGCWIVGIINSTIHTTYLLHLPFCGTRVIDHFFCEVPAMLKVSCVDTSHYEGGVNVSAVFFLLIPFSIILASYAQILRTVLHIKSVEAQKKAFSTCSSHLTVVVMYYGPFIFTYMRPKSYHTPGQDKVLAILYTILTPMLNPIIYSLRNKDVLCALKKVVGNTFMHRN